MSLLNLPTEVLTQIVAIFRPSYHGTHRRGHKTDNVSLRSVSLTCWLLRRIATPFLFAFVSVRDGSLSNFFLLIQSNPQVARSVLELQLGGDAWGRPEAQLHDTVQGSVKEQVDLIILNETALDSDGKVIPRTRLWPSANTNHDCGSQFYGRQAVLQSLILTFLSKLEVLRCFRLQQDDESFALCAWKGKTLSSLKEVGDFHVAYSLSVSAFSALFVNSPRLETLFGPFKSIGRTFTFSCPSLRHLHLRESVSDQTGLQTLLGAFPQLETLHYEYFERAEEVYDEVDSQIASPREVCESIAVLAGSLKHLTMEMHYPDQRANAESLYMPLKDLAHLESLELRGDAAHYGLEEVYMFPIEWRTMLPPNLVHLWFYLDEWYDAGIYAAHLPLLASVASELCPRLKTVGAIRLDDEVSERLEEAFEAVGIEYSSDI